MAFPPGLRCTECGGTLLPPTRFGSTRGSCHCWRGPGRVAGNRYYHGPDRPVVWEYVVEFPDVPPATFSTNHEAWRHLLHLRTLTFMQHGRRTWPALPSLSIEEQFRDFFRDIKW